MKHHDTVIALTAAGHAQTEIAAAAGISVRTVRRLQQHPDVRAAVAEAREQLERHALTRLAELRSTAFDRLQQLAASDDPHVALRTVTIILTQGLAYRAAAQADQLAAFEHRLADLTATLTPTGDLR